MLRNASLKKRKKSKKNKSVHAKMEEGTTNGNLNEQNKISKIPSSFANYRVGKNGTPLRGSSKLMMATI